MAFAEPTGSISFTHCAFLGGQSYEVQVTAAAAASTLSFRECWWETTSPESIGTLIWDCSDDPELSACVDFSNWCTDPGCAGQATSVPDETQPESVTWGSIKSRFR